MAQSSGTTSKAQNFLFQLSSTAKKRTHETTESEATKQPPVKRMKKEDENVHMPTISTQHRGLGFAPRTMLKPAINLLIASKHKVLAAQHTTTIQRQTAIMRPITHASVPIIQVAPTPDTVARIRGRAVVTQEEPSRADLDLDEEEEEEEDIRLEEMRKDLDMRWARYTE